MRKIAHWLEEFSPAESLDIYRELAYSHARESGPLKDQLLSLIRAGDFRGLVEFELNYSDESLSVNSVKNARQALAFFQKLPDLKIGIDKEKVALQKFLEAEELCRETNSILSMRRSGLCSWPGRVESIFLSAQRKIARVLGPVPSISELDLRFGPGATIGTKRSEASIRRKLTEELQCSEDFLPIASMVLGEMPHLVGIHETDRDVERLNITSCEGGLIIDEMASVPVEIVPARLNFVPKNAKTCRSICVEPGLNVLFQLAVGSWMAKRLAAFGVDIRDQSLNQRRAREGSLTGALATLDLSSASDTISREIVYELLPLDWAELLHWGRSNKATLPSGEVIAQEKFSSMGNGFTFPLETLIFWSLAASCCEQDSDVSVYGDDIVLPTKDSALLMEILRYAGFKVNVGKSYTSGPFRESCGKDYIRGIDVRPFYAKGWVNGQLLFVLHNFYVRNADPDRARWVENLIHPALRIWGPDGYGDGHLVGDHERRRPHKYHIRGFGGYFFDTFTTKQRRDIVPIAAGDAVLPAYTVYRRSGVTDVKIVDVISGETHQLDAPDGGNVDVCKSTLLRDLQHRLVQSAPLPLPEKEGTKALTLPGVDGYKKITIYTLGG
jgi:hypothetical protein